MRFQRHGKRNRPFFKIVVIDKKAPPKGGRPVAIVGWYDPITKEKGFDKEKILFYLSHGVKPSESVLNLLKKEKIVD